MVPLHYLPSSNILGLLWWGGCDLGVWDLILLELHIALVTLRPSCRQTHQQVVDVQGLPQLSAVADEYVAAGTLTDLVSILWRLRRLAFWDFMSVHSCCSLLEKSYGTIDEIVGMSLLVGRAALATQVAPSERDYLEAGEGHWAGGQTCFSGCIFFLVKSCDSTLLGQSSLPHSPTLKYKFLVFVQEPPAPGSTWYWHLQVLAMIVIHCVEATIACHTVIPLPGWQRGPDQVWTTPWEVLHDVSKWDFSYLTEGMDVWQEGMDFLPYSSEVNQHHTYIPVLAASVEFATARWHEISLVVNCKEGRAVVSVDGKQAG